MNIFYHKGDFFIDKELILTTEEAFHAVKVLRCRHGEQVILLNGLGGSAIATVSQADIKSFKLEVESVTHDSGLIPARHIALALLKKKERIEWFVEKAVETGISSITIFTADHTEKKGLDLARLERVAISAMKQSGNKWLPDIKGLIKFEDMLEKFSYAQKYIGYCKTPETELLKNKYKAGTEAVVVIGPEGDFSEEEIELAELKGLIPVSLGSARLRAETAALHALFTMHLANL